MLQLHVDLQLTDTISKTEMPEFKTFFFLMLNEIWWNQANRSFFPYVVSLTINAQHVT